MKRGNILKKLGIFIIFVMIFLSVSACSNLETTYTNEAPTIELSYEGSDREANTTRVYAGDEFIDPGYTCTDDHDTVCEVDITSNVDMSNAGLYTVTYQATDSEGLTTIVTRDVLVKYRFHIDKFLLSERNIEFADLEYSELDENFILQELDYSDDEREMLKLWEYSNNNSKIVFEDPYFHELVRLTLGFEEGQDIFYSDLQTVTELKSHLYEISEIRSIKGIELFRNLESLWITDNRNFTSINGIQHLPNLKSLTCSRTAVRKIDYDSDSLESLIFPSTRVSFDSTMDLLNAIADYPNLDRLIFRDNDIVVDDLENLAGRFKYTDDPDVECDIFQIDFNKVDFSRKPIYISIYTHNVRFLDYHNSSAIQKFVDEFERLYEKIGISEDMSELTKIFLIYDFVYDRFKEQNEEHHSYTYAMYLFRYDVNPYKVSEDEATVFLSMFLNRAGIKANIIGTLFTIGDLGTMDVFYNDDTHRTLVTLSNGQQLMIDIYEAFKKYREGNESPYELFLVGTETLEKYMYNEYLKGKCEKSEDEFFFMSTAFYAQVNPGDISREAILDSIPKP